MNNNRNETDKVIQDLLNIANLKKDLYENTLNSFKKLKETSLDFSKYYKDTYQNSNPRILIEMKDRSEFEFELKFGGDVLIFIMHSNIFEFPRAHSIYKLPYIKENKNRSYCGIINIYNFLADSFKYNRINDLGYLIGRIFINTDNHYYIEGKHELGLNFNNFANNIFTNEVAKNIINSSINYTINFDLLTPDYETNKEITVFDIQQLEIQNTTIKTGKRLGFQFQADNNEISY